MADSVNLELLKRLCATPGIAGREDRVRAVVAEELRPLVDELRIDALGSVIGTRRGDGPRVMLAAHMDEIGFFVSHIDDNGFLRLQPVGGFDRPDPDCATGARSRVSRVRPAWGAAAGNQADPSPRSGRDQAGQMEELFVDVGLPVERVRDEIELGDIVTLERELVEVGDCVMSKALDDRVGVFVMLEALRAMGQSTPKSSPWPPPRKRSGCGARRQRVRDQPDIAVALDTTLALDIPGMPSELAVSHLGRGWRSKSWTRPTSPTQRWCGTCVTWPKPMESPTSSRSCRAGGPTRGRCNAPEAARRRSPSRSHRAMSTRSTRWPTDKTSPVRSRCWRAFSKTRDRDPMGTSGSLVSREMVTDRHRRRWIESSAAG